jgi:hypothetical protein
MKLFEQTGKLKGRRSVLGGGDPEGEALYRQGNLFGQSFQCSHAPASRTTITILP